MTAATRLENLRRAVAPFGLVLRGGFHPGAADGVPCPPGRGPVGTLLLLGNAGGAMWAAFARSAEQGDGRSHPLDRWTRRVVDGIARDLGAAALYPFGGPPWHPFQRWALAGDAVAPSPVGVLIHPEYGLWHAYRAALAFAGTLDLPARDPRPRPCETCAAKPCLSTCPVGAFRPEGYDVETCRDHVGGASGLACRQGGCFARLACPVGRGYAYPPDQMAFHMAAFLAGRSDGGRKNG